MDGSTVVLQLSGSVTLEHIEELKAEMAKETRIALDLQQTTAIDLEVVQFLAASEANGIALRRCPRYLRKWIENERTKMS